ncbi:MAG: hypothetical protein ACOWWO_15530 [Peptococcaceae bacterium]
MGLLTIIEKGKQAIILSYVLLFLIYSFFPVAQLKAVMFPVVILILLISFPSVKDYNKYLALGLFALGAALMIYNQGGIFDIITGFTDNAGLISLILTVPLLSIVFDFENFDRTISNITNKYIDSSRSFYVTTLLTINSLGMLLNLASIPLVHQVLGNTGERYPAKLYYRALTRGFCVNLLWSPNFVSIAVVLNYIDISWYKLAPLGFLLAMVNNILGIFLEQKAFLPAEEKSEARRPVKAVEKGKLSKLILLMVSLILFIIILELIIQKSVLVVVPLVSFAAPVLLALAFGKTQIFRTKFKDYYVNGLAGKTNEVFLFTAIGFFGYALGRSPFQEYIPLLIEKFGIATPAPLMFLILFIIGGLSVTGVHPLVSISAIAVTVPVASTPLNELQMALTLLTGYMIYNLLSPFSIPTLVVSDLAKENPLTVSLKLNLPYVLLSGFFTILIALFL